MNLTRTLVALPYSPWSNKAQWALDVAGVDYDVALHTPMIGEPGLRRRIKRSGAVVSKATVPVLFEGDRPALTDSFDIARRAAALNPEAGLIPDAHAAGIEAWNTRSEVTCNASRALVSQAIAADPAALRETLPAPLRLPVISTVIGRSGMAYFKRKYDLDRAGDAERALLRSTLGDWRAALDGRDYVFGALTYADLTMAVLLHAVDPPAEMVIGPAGRRAWRQAELAEAFPDLIEWRDGLIARHPPRWDRLAS